MVIIIKLNVVVEKGYVCDENFKINVEMNKIISCFVYMVFCYSFGIFVFLC